MAKRMVINRFHSQKILSSGPTKTNSFKKASLSLLMSSKIKVISTPKETNLALILVFNCENKMLLLDRSSNNYP